MEENWTIEKIQEILPQKYPFLFIDRVIEFSAQEKRIVCLKNVSINDYFFQGHFPENPILPGVIIIEAMAQASILLFAGLKPEIAKKKPTYFLGKVEAKFLRPVRPGDCMKLEVQGLKLLDKSGIVSAKAKVNNDVAAEAQLIFGVKV